MPVCQGHRPRRRPNDPARGKFRVAHESRRKRSFSSLKSAKVGRFRQYLRRVRHSILLHVGERFVVRQTGADYKCHVVFRTIRALELVAVSFLIAISTTAFGQLRPADCARAAKYSESKRGISMLVIQNGRTIFEHYANGGSSGKRWPIFSGTKSFWGLAALAGVRDGLFKLDDLVSDTISEWKSDSRKSRITILQLLSQTDGIEGASRLQRASMRDRNAMAIRLPTVAEPGSAFIYGPSHLQIFSELLRRKLQDRAITAYVESRVLNRLGLSALVHHSIFERPDCATRIARKILRRVFFAAGARSRGLTCRGTKYPAQFRNMNKFAIGCGVVLVILLFIAVVAALALGGSYNRRVRLQQSVDQSWAQVQNVYQRRADLIPRLVNTGSGAAHFEKSTLLEATHVRSS